ncbi:hypothetical protein BJ165DRAFT_1597531 [Panaeolus papilionaceus]|nr:hypothetical protein BJ165DRAFT_1597531 [Panaeolus papilionaceus]
MFKQNLRPEQMVIPTHDKIQLLKNRDGYLHIRRAPTCVVGSQDVDPKEAMDLWNLSKETQRGGFYPHGRWTAEQERRYEGKMGPERAMNPVVVLDWMWDKFVVKNAIEITPEAMRDAERLRVDKTMRFGECGGERAGDGDLKIEVVNGVCGLVHNINVYIKSKEPSNMKVKMAPYDKRIHMEMQMQYNSELVEGMSIPPMASGEGKSQTPNLDAAVDAGEWKDMVGVKFKIGRRQVISFFPSGTLFSMSEQGLILPDLTPTNVRVLAQRIWSARHKSTKRAEISAQAIRDKCSASETQIRLNAVGKRGYTEEEIEDRDGYIEGVVNVHKERYPGLYEVVREEVEGGGKEKKRRKNADAHVVREARELLGSVKRRKMEDEGSSPSEA